MEPPKSLAWNGRRYDLLGARGYYLRSATTNRGRKGAKGLHVDVWEFHSAKTVPAGCHIHHKDGNPLNNEFENLVCLTPKEHAKLHKRRQGYHRFQQLGVEAAKAWHRSTEGRRWHILHGKELWENKKPTVHVCRFCSKRYLSRKTSRAFFCSTSCQQKYNYWRRKWDRPRYSSHGD